MAGRHRLLACVAGWLLTGMVPTAHAEFVVSPFSGVTTTQDNDLRLRRAGGTDLEFHGVSYRTRDLQPPIYYGGRVAWLLPRPSHWGFGLGFFHAKVYLNTDAIVVVRGTRAGAPVDAPERVGDTIDAFNISHGLNFLTADAIHRWSLDASQGAFPGRWQPYLGAGIGVAIPHVESTIGGVRSEGYQLHGPAYQAFLGFDVGLTRRWSLFSEYKLTYVDLNRLVIPDGWIGLAPVTHHVAGGVSSHFGKAR